MGYRVGRVGTDYSDMRTWWIWTESGVGFFASYSQNLFIAMNVLHALAKANSYAQSA
jgi:hypothetical protein